jgi:diadenosine tetraphosphate (Ap4A) HIT family hydrolase
MIDVQTMIDNGAALDAECVFCSRRDQPTILFERSFLYCMPDKYPLLPGHILIISKRHLSCYAAASARELEELDSMVAVVRRFLSDAYGGTFFSWESGVTGQSVFHAHLHVSPVPHPGLRPALDRFDDVFRITDWGEVVAHFAQHGGYRYLDTGRAKYVISSDSAAIDAARAALAAVTGVSWNGAWEKRATNQDVVDLGQRWSDWSAALGRINRA